MHVDRDAPRILPVFANDELGTGSFGVALAIGAVSPMILLSSRSPVGSQTERDAASSSSQAR